MLDLTTLTIIHYPDPRLHRRCAPVERFDDELAALAARMHELMRAGKGVGLAAPQVGVPIRLFVMNPTGEPADALNFVNPVIDDRQGSAEKEEGCLSLPGVFVMVRRAAACSIRALDLTGRPFALSGSDLIARVWQHEVDHLDGKLITDRMGPADKLATRKILRALEENYRRFGAGRRSPSRATRSQA